MRHFVTLKNLKKKGTNSAFQELKRCSFPLLALFFLLFNPDAQAQVQTETQGDSSLKILVATTRKYAVTKDYPGGWLTGERGAGLIYGELTLKPPQKKLLRSLLLLGKTGWSVDQLYVPTMQRAANDFTQAAFGRDILIYVHGYRETFESSAISAFKLAQDIEFRDNVGLFTWPSGGSTFDYGYDRESAIWSREFFAQLIRALERSKSGGRVHLVAHSMGTLLTLEALRDVRLQGGNAALSRIGAIVLASPDVDMDIFQQAVERLGTDAKKITVITAGNDRALALSSILAGGVRAGTVDRERLEKLGVRVADASEFGGGVFNHDLFLTNPDVIQVVRRAIDRSR